MKKIFIFLFIIMGSCFVANSQSTDFGGILEVDFEKSCKSLLKSLLKKRSSSIIV